MSKIPMRAVQRLFDRHGVAITLQFIAAACRDRSLQWEEKAEIVDAAAQQVKRVERDPDTKHNTTLGRKERHNDDETRSLGWAQSRTSLVD